MVSINNKSISSIVANVAKSILKDVEKSKAAAPNAPPNAAAKNFGTSSYSNSPQACHMQTPAPVAPLPSIPDLEAHLKGCHNIEHESWVAVGNAESAVSNAQITLDNAVTNAANAGTAEVNARAEATRTEAAAEAAREKEAAAAKRESCPELPDKTYASTLNGMTVFQLAEERKAIEQQMRQLPEGSEERKALQKKLDMVFAEYDTRPKGFYDRVADDRARLAIQNDYKHKSNEQLDADLRQLFTQCSTSAAGGTPSIQSNQGKDSELQMRIGAIQAELAKRGIPPVTPEKVALENATADRQRLEKAAADAKTALTNATQAKKDADAAVAAAKQALDAAQKALAAAKDWNAAAKENARVAQEALDKARQAEADAIAKAAAAAAYQEFINQRNNAVLQLLANVKKLGGWDGKMSWNDLYKALNDSKSSEALKDAIRFLIANTSVFDEIDIAKNGGKHDGVISEGDLLAIKAKWGI